MTVAARHYSMGLVRRLLLLLTIPTLLIPMGSAPVSAQRPASGVCGLASGFDVEVDEYLTRLFGTYGDSGDGWTGADGTRSVELPDGRIVWMFSDSFLGTVNPDRSRPPSPLINNTFVVQDGDVLSTLHGGTESDPAAYVVPSDADWYWPTDGTVERGRLRAFMPKFTRTGPGAWDWEWSGTDIVSFSLPGLMEQGTRAAESSNGVSYGTWIIEAKRHTYIYGIEDHGAAKYTHVARARRGHLLGTWRFFTGSGWSLDPLASRRILDISATGVVKAGGRYLLIGMDTHPPLWEWKEIVLYRSRRPTGPWIGRTVLYSVPEADEGDLFTYNAVAHPDLSSPSGFVLSYDVNSFEFLDLFSNVDNYRPRFIRIGPDCSS